MALLSQFHPDTKKNSTTQWPKKTKSFSNNYHIICFGMYWMLRFENFYNIGFVIVLFVKLCSKQFYR